MDYVLDLLRDSLRWGGGDSGIVFRARRVRGHGFFESVHGILYGGLGWGGGDSGIVVRQVGGCTNIKLDTFLQEVP